MNRALGVLLVAAAMPLNGHGREIHITLVHTCDLHGNVLPTENYDGRTNLGGIARCATVIRQIRAQQRNTLVLDTGDTIQGTAISYLSGGQVMVKALNLLRYDAWVWGNHEFDWGLEKLASCAAAARMPILNANVTGIPILKPYIIREIQGVKVGIIGLNTPGIPNWSRPRLIAGLKFADSIETLKSVVPAVRRDGAQVLVLVCHQGYRDAGDDHANQINAIARHFPELDVIIGGHTHREVPELMVGNVLYCQAGYFGIHLGRVDLVYDTVIGRVSHRESKSMIMDERIPLDAELLRECGEEIDRAQKSLGTVIGEAVGVFNSQGAPKHETPVHNLIFESIVEALGERGVKVDAVVHGILDARGVLAPGPVSVGDVWKVVPYENTLGVLHVTPSQMKAILDENAAAYEKREFRGIWGLRWTFGSVGTVSFKRADGAQLKDDERIAVAFNSYELASGGLRWKKLRELADLPETSLTEFDVQTRGAVIDYIRHHRQIQPVVRGWWKPEPGH